VERKPTCEGFNQRESVYAAPNADGSDR
jgi:hypothetical protein